MKYFATFAVIALLAAGCTQTTPQTSNSNTSTETTNTSENSNTAQSTSVTMAQVESANSQSKCYTIVNGTVYDVTSFFGKHKGGDANLLKVCGKDGTELFTKQHGGQPQPEATLAGFKIGELAK